MAAGRGVSSTGPGRDDPAHRRHGARRRSGYKLSTSQMAPPLWLRETRATAPSSAVAWSELSLAASTIFIVARRLGDVTEDELLALVADPTREGSS